MHIVLPVSLQKVCGTLLKFRLDVYFKNDLSLLPVGMYLFEHIFYDQPLRSGTPSLRSYTCVEVSIVTAASCLLIP